MTDSFRSYAGRLPKVGGVGDEVRKRNLANGVLAAGNGEYLTPSTYSSSVLLVINILNPFKNIFIHFF